MDGMHTAAGQVLHAETLMLIGNHHSLFSECFIEREKNRSTAQLARVQCAAAQAYTFAFPLICCVNA